MIGLTSLAVQRLQSIFGDHLYQAAQQLIDAGGVLDVRVVQAGRIVTGVAAAGVLDEQRATRHRVYIQYPAGQPTSGAAYDTAECSCDARSPCLHIAAVALAAIDRPAPAAPAPRSSTQSLPQAVRNSGTAPRQQLFFLCEAAAHALQVSVWVGQLSDGDHTRPENVCTFAPRLAPDSNEYPRYVSPADAQILSGLAALHADGPWCLRGTAGGSLLQQLLTTGRAFWQTFQGRPLQVGAECALDLSWRVLPSGEQQLALSGGTFAVSFAVEPAVYIDTATGRCGPLALPCSQDLLRRYWNRRIAPEEVAEVSADIVGNCPTFPPLQMVEVHKRAFSQLQARLRLTAGPDALLYFVYDGAAVDSRALRADDDLVRVLNPSSLHQGTEVWEFERDRNAERHLQTPLERVLPNALQDNSAWLAFMLESVPALRADGWEIECAPDFPYQLAQAEEWYADLATQDKDQWFDLQLGVNVAGRSVNLLPALVNYLQATFDNEDCCRVGDHLLLRLDDRCYLPIPIERVQRIADTLVELLERDSLNKRAALSLPLSHVHRLAHLLPGSVLRSDEQALLTRIRDLEHFAGIDPLPAPPEFHATLRAYQQEGLGWLQFLRRYQLGGILADDMGLGKTVQTIAHLLLEKQQGRATGPSLIVAPVSVIGNWQQELRRLAPSLKVLTLHGAGRKELFPGIRGADIVITGYPSLQLDRETLLAQEFYFVILDEAQLIKNPRAKVSHAARALRTQYRLCLSGTPMENHLGELWSLFDFLQPGLLGDQRSFQRHYRLPIEKNGNRARAAALTRRIAPFVLRRTKDAVARELPPKTQIVESLVMDERQRDFYDGIRLAMHRRVREVIEQQGLARSQITMLDALLKLRQACCDPRLINNSPHAIPSAKMDWLLTVLPELVAEGRRILLFSQFTTMLRLIEAAIAPLSIPYCLLTGETPQRAALVQRFQSGQVPLFLISLKAGGTGLNLTAADTVIHYDPWWNPAAEAQATDRAHRIGQDQPVFVYKLIAQGTVEEKIMQLQADKQALASQLYAGTSTSPSQLSAADLQVLFAP